ncbi:MAG: hypothetical protein ATN35_02455 [Epulopiscium sp. Nele67-Bin004]|nr:MAG: hypothetical protein ATN35_02455 [Epulopiscium sp. Nele67-Bin004]
MSKYNFDFDPTLGENSLTKLIDRIEPNSTVLEFGPAHGRLTKYLSEQMNCEVTIVEIDDEAGNEASTFAKESFVGEDVGNIENYKWATLIDNKFDYILFADVLEHLYYPQKVLEKAKEFLKDTGAILVSIPNISHHSVIIDLIQDKFEYREIGLLDNTHIRFFTKQSFVSMIDKIPDLKISEIDATYCQVGNNEFGNSYSDLNCHLQTGLQLLEEGHVYQYIFDIRKNYDTDIVDNLKPNSNKQLTVYFADDIENLDEKNSIYIKWAGKTFSQAIDIEDSEQNIHFIRIDPIETVGVFKVNDIKIYYKNEQVASILYATNASLNIGELFVFDNTDPQIIYQISSGKVDKVEIVLEILDLNISHMTKRVCEFIQNNGTVSKLELQLKDNHINNLNEHIENLESVREQQQEQINTLNNELQLKDNHVTNLDEHIANLESVREQQQEQINTLNNEMQLKDNHVTNLDEHIANLESVREQQNEQINTLNNELQLKDNHVSNLDEHIENLESVREQQQEQINTLNNELQLKDNHVANLDEHIANLESAREQQQEQIQNLEINLVQQQDLYDKDTKALQEQIFKLTQFLHELPKNRKKIGGK